MNKKVAFIGTGNMGGALIRSACKVLGPKQVYITDFYPQKAQELAQELGCHCLESNAEAVEAADYIFLCVKPQVLEGAVKSMLPSLSSALASGRGKCLVSIAAGIQLAALRAMLGGQCPALPIIRVMPSMTATVGQAMLALCADSLAAEEQIKDVEGILSGAGRVDRLSEGLMDQFTVVSGCLPAYVFMFIEAIADGAVITGLPRQQAMLYAAQTIIGAATMVLEGGHPAALKDAVCSPGGSTIAGVAALEGNGFRHAAIQAVVEAYNKNLELGKQ